MFDKERILFQLERTRVLSLQMIERVPQEKWFEMPMGITHVAWNVGHMAIAEYFLGMVFIRGPFRPSALPQSHRDSGHSG